MTPEATSTIHLLVLLRHAKSSWEGDRADEDRPLSARGRRDADAVGEWLVEHAIVPDLVLCSIAERTRETWARALASAPGLATATVSYRESIYQAWSDRLLELVHQLPESVGTAMLVGHAPGLPDLAARLNRAHATGPEPAFSTSALTVLEVSGPWAETGPGSARVSAYAVPRG